MQSRIDRFCDLVANPLKNAHDILHFLANEEVDLNDRHSRHHSRPVDFAAQTGSLSSLRYLVEDAKVDVRADALRSTANLLTWGSCNKTLPEVTAYLLDPAKKIWLRFEDGTTDLHAAALAGYMAEVERALDADPDRIAELAKGKYNLMYWAHRGEHPELQVRLSIRMQEYKARHAANIERMRDYHLGMTHFNIALTSSYDDFDLLLQALTEERVAAPDKALRIGIILKLIGKEAGLAVEKIKNNIETKADMLRDLTSKELNALHRGKVLTNAIKLNTLRLKALRAIEKKDSQDEHELAQAEIEGLTLLFRAGYVPYKLAEHELSSATFNVERLKKLVDQSYRKFEDAYEFLSGISLEKKSRAVRAELNMLLVQLNLAELNFIELIRKITRHSDAPIFTPNPQKVFITLIRNYDKSLEDLSKYINSELIDINKPYRNKRAVEHVVEDSEGTVERLNFLIDTLGASVDVSADKAKKNLLQLARNEKVSREMKAYLLDPQRKLWEKFNDGTTDLHAHAFAGRMGEVTRILNESPDRISEMNDKKENVFYWAYFGKQTDKFENPLKAINVEYIISNVQEEQLNKILDFFQSMEACLKDCFSGQDAVSFLTSNINLLLEINVIKENQKNGYQKVLNYLYRALVDAYRHFKTEDVSLEMKNADLALTTANLVVDTAAAKKKMYSQCIESKYFALVHLGNEAYTRAELAIEEGSYEGAKYQYMECANSFTTALELLEQISVEPEMEELVHDRRMELQRHLKSLPIKILNMQEILGEVMPSTPAPRRSYVSSPSSYNENGKEEKDMSRSSGGSSSPLSESSYASQLNRGIYHSLSSSSLSSTPSTRSSPTSSSSSNSPHYSYFSGSSSSPTRPAASSSLGGSRSNPPLRFFSATITVDSDVDQEILDFIRDSSSEEKKSPRRR